MEHSDILKMFFSRMYEQDLNAMILEDVDYDIDEYGILNYVANVIDVPYSEFLHYIEEHPSYDEIVSRSITQSSSFSACEKEMVDVLLAEQNRGLSMEEIGGFFPQYRRSDEPAALKKYGENQVKTAEQLGLTYQYYSKWYLNCTGYIYNQLEPADKQCLLARNILRDPLYRQMMLDIQFHDINIVSYMSCLKSNETKLRRYDSVKRLIDISVDECQRCGLPIYSVINYKPILEAIVKQEKNNKKAKKTSKAKVIKLPDTLPEIRFVADESLVDCSLPKDKK